jgi:hypothetical protein
LVVGHLLMALLQAAVLLQVPLWHLWWRLLLLLPGTERRRQLLQQVAPCWLQQLLELHSVSAAVPAVRTQTHPV